MRRILPGVPLCHDDVADLARVGPRRHRIEAVGEMRRTHPSKVGVGLVHGGVGKIVVGAVGRTDSECHDSPSLKSAWVAPSSAKLTTSEMALSLTQCDCVVTLGRRHADSVVANGVPSCRPDWRAETSENRKRANRFTFAAFMPPS